MSSEPATSPDSGSRRELYAWALYDWANSAYSALSITILVYYIKAVVAPGALGTLIWGWGIGLSMLLAALMSPVVGALADANRNKALWLKATALGGALAALLLAIIPPEFTWGYAALFFLTSLCFELSLGFYNGFLPEIADEESMNRVSAFGFGLGYVGGGIALALAVVVLGFGGWFGLPDGTALTKDLNSTARGRFVVDLPEGDYEVSVTLGDPTSGRDQMLVRLQSELVDSVSTAAGEHLERTYPVNLTRGRFELEIEAARQGDEAAMNALVIRRAGGGDGARQFDFGTRGSEVQVGYQRVTPRNQYGVEPPAEDRQRPGELTSNSNGNASFGWESGVIHARDAVTPIRLRIGLVIMGLWWAVFSIPMLLVLKDHGPPRVRQPSPVQAAREAVRQVATTLGNVRVYRMLFLFLIAFLIYNDGIQTVISQASLFAIDALDMPPSELILVVLMIQFLALPGAWAVGRLSDHIGQKPALLLCLSVFMGLLVAAFFVTTSLQFWIMGAVLAMVMGGSQSVSRAIMGMMTPRGRAAEFFGFFNFSGKATSFLGPIVFSTILAQTDSAHLAIVSLLVFFVVGSLLVARLDVARGRREALQAGGATG